MGASCTPWGPHALHGGLMHSMGAHALHGGLMYFYVHHGGFMYFVLVLCMYFMGGSCTSYLYSACTSWGARGLMYFRGFMYLMGACVLHGGIMYFMGVCVLLGGSCTSCRASGGSWGPHVHYVGDSWGSCTSCGGYVHHGGFMYFMGFMYFIGRSCTSHVLYGGSVYGSCTSHVLHTGSCNLVPRPYFQFVGPGARNLIASMGVVMEMYDIPLGESA
jgi:hypothetical protein